MLIQKDPKNVPMVNIRDCDYTPLVPGDILIVVNAMGNNYLNAIRPTGGNNSIPLFFPEFDMQMKIVKGVASRFFNGNYSGYQILDMVISGTTFHLEPMPDWNKDSKSTHWKVCA